MKLKYNTQPAYLRYTPRVLVDPPLQLNGSMLNSYINNVTFAQAIHIFQPKTFLDFGCYLGGLPLMVEDLLELAHSDRQLQTQWYLFDNFSFLKEIERINHDYDHWINSKDASFRSWRRHVYHLRNKNSRGVLKELPIPTDPQTLKDFLTSLAATFNAPYPNIKSITDDLTAINGIKFDMILFDLDAGATCYPTNRQRLTDLVQHNLADGGIIALDDVAAVHEGQLLLFLDAVNEMGLGLVGVAGDKVFLQKTSWHASKQDRNAWLEEIYRSRAWSENITGKDFFFYLFSDLGQYGRVLKMLPNKTHLQ